MFTDATLFPFIETVMVISKNAIRTKYLRINHSLNEKTRRLWCAIAALSIGVGGVTLVHSATKVSRLLCPLSIIDEPIFIKMGQQLITTESTGHREKV